MTAFCIYDDDGRIFATNKVFDADESYEAKMNEDARKWIKREQSTLISLDTNYVHTTSLELRERKQMLISVSKERIEAGGIDSVVFKGIPSNARLQVSNNIPGVGVVVPYDLIMEAGDTEFEYAIDMPCMFTVSFTRWPYQDWSMQFEATAP